MYAFMILFWCGLLMVLMMRAAGCANDVNPSPEPSGLALTIDEEFTRVAQKVPGFGGCYYDDSGALNVVLTHPSLQLNSIRAVLSSHGIKGSGELVVQQGQYDFVELSQWRHRLDAVMLSGLH